MVLERAEPINFLELHLLKFFMALSRYCKSWKASRHMRIKTDNTPFIAYANNMVGTVSQK